MPARSRAGMDLARLNDGRLRHPLFGNREHWYSQDVKAGFVARAVKRTGPQIQDAVLDVIDDVLAKLASRGH